MGRYHTVTSADVGVSMCVITTHRYRRCAPWQRIGVTCRSAELRWLAGVVDRDMGRYHTVTCADVRIGMGIITTHRYRCCAPWQGIGVTCRSAELRWLACVVDRDMCRYHTVT